MSNAVLEGELVEERAVIATSQLQELAERINLLDGQTVAAITMGLEQAIQAGEALTEAKKVVGHGKWLVWLAENCPDVGQRSAAKYMQIYQASRDGKLSQISTGANSSINAVVAALSSPRRGTPDPTAGETDDDEDTIYYPDERLRLARHAIRAIVEIEVAPAFRGLTGRQRSLTKALVDVLNSYEDDNNWHLAVRALKSFNAASEGAVKKASK